ncbi:MAG: class I tRNA ligase family protein, partial [Immundisolibacteraceae bacterium]|nr:class I tRNA ligase family protein [Immundisolibacteraceae bacterium]
QAQFDFDKEQFNTVVSAGMKLVNELSRSLAKISEASEAQVSGQQSDFVLVMDEALSVVIRMLGPIIPHACHALWQQLTIGTGADQQVDIADAPWPQVDESALTRQQLELVVQVNGKVRAKINVSAEADKKQLETLACNNENVVRFIDGKAIRKVIVVPGKLVNIVV